MMARRLALIAAAVLAAACVEDLSAPGVCPNYCPTAGLTIADTVLYDLSRDSSFRGYVLPHRSALLLALKATKELRQTTQFQIACRLEQTGEYPGNRLLKAIAGKTQSDQSVIVRPDRSVVV